MIQIVEGKIGSGKSYYAVRHMLKRYYEYDSSTMSWYPVKPHILISNISDLKLDHINLDDLVKEKGLKYVFSEEFVNHLRDGRNIPVVYIVDECQAPHMFHRKYYDTEVFFFFQKSRHYGLDMYLITQDVDSVAKEIKVLPEHIIHAVQRSLTAGVNFHYKQLSGGEVENNFIVRKDQRIFRAYSSFKHAEGEKPRPVLIKYAVYSFLLLVVAVVSYRAFIGSFSVESKKLYGKDKKSSSLVSSPVPPSSGSGHVIEYKDFKKNKVRDIRHSPSVSPVASSLSLGDPSAGVRDLSVSDVVKCQKVGIIEYDRVYHLHQCGDIVFKVADNKIVSSRLLSPKVAVSQIPSGSLSY